MFLIFPHLTISRGQHDQITTAVFWVRANISWCCQHCGLSGKGVCTRRHDHNILAAVAAAAAAATGLCIKRGTREFLVPSFQYFLTKYHHWGRDLRRSSFQGSYSSHVEKEENHAQQASVCDLESGDTFVLRQSAFLSWRNSMHKNAVTTKTRCQPGGKNTKKEKKRGVEKKEWECGYYIHVRTTLSFLGGGGAVIYNDNRKSHWMPLIWFYCV